MSGDCKNQPIIFYSKEMTVSKMILLSSRGIKFDIEELKKSNSNNYEIDHEIYKQLVQKLYGENLDKGYNFFNYMLLD